MAVTSFIPTLWNARLLYNLEKAHVATNIVNRNYEGEIKNVGDKVKINTISDITIRSYSAGTPITVEDLTTTGQNLEIDQAKYFAFAVEDIDATQAAGDLVDTATQRASYGLVDSADAFILGKIAAAGIASNKPTVGSESVPVTLTSSNVYEKIVALRTLLDKQNVPTQGRSVVVSPDVYALLLLDERFAKNDVTAGDVTLNGYVGRVAGFDVYESNNCVSHTYTPVGGGAAVVSTIITAQHIDATTYAEQIVKTEAFRPEGKFADAVKGLHVYGAKVINADGIAAMFATV